MTAPGPEHNGALTSSDSRGELEPVDADSAPGEDVVEVSPGASGGLIGGLSDGRELVQALGEEGDREAYLQALEKAFQLQRDHNEHVVATYKEIVDIKKRDPDQIAKHLNERVRRFSRYALGGCAIVPIFGAVASAVTGPLVVTALLGTFGSVSLVMLYSLEAGVPVKVEDISRLVGAIRRLGSARAEGDRPDDRSGQKR